MTDGKTRSAVYQPTNSLRLDTVREVALQSIGLVAIDEGSQISDTVYAIRIALIPNLTCQIRCAHRSHLVEKIASVKWLNALHHGVLVDAKS
jgi:hypothetical protein